MLDLLNANCVLECTSHCTGIARAQVNCELYTGGTKSRQYLLTSLCANLLHHCETSLPETNLGRLRRPPRRNEQELRHPRPRVDPYTRPLGVVQSLDRAIGELQRRGPG